MEKQIKNNWLSEHRKKSVSQFGEEGILEKIFDIIGTENKWCVEFGAVSGKNDSTSWHLINKKKWSGVLIEANKVYYKKLEDNYSTIDCVTCMNAYVNFEGKNKLDNLLGKTKIPKNFDFLSIDIDGNDYHVWKAIKKYKPRVVMIEYNGNIPSDIDFVQPRDMNVQQGSSLSVMVNLAREKGYELIYAHMFNAIFVKAELFPLFNISDNSPTTLTEGDFPNARFFQLFDGSIVLHGYKKTQLLAHKRKIKNEAIWHLTDDEFYPVKFTYDNKTIRFVKNIIKDSFLYTFLYPIARRKYKKKWKEKQKKLLETN